MPSTGFKARRLSSILQRLEFQIITKEPCSMNELLLQLGHSPDPDDAFMFYGLAKDKLPTGRYRFEHVLQDIQTLNQRAMKGNWRSPPSRSTPTRTSPTSTR